MRGRRWAPCSPSVACASDTGSSSWALAPCGALGAAVSATGAVVVTITRGSELASSVAVGCQDARLGDVRGLSVAFGSPLAAGASLRVVTCCRGACSLALATGAGAAGFFATGVGAAGAATSAVVSDGADAVVVICTKSLLPVLPAWLERRPRERRRGLRPCGLASFAVGASLASTAVAV